MKKLFSILMENGIVISIALGMSYLLSYHYQKGKLDYYGIPILYADFSLPNIVAVFSIALTMCYIGILFANPILYFAIGTRDYRMIKIWIFLAGVAITFGIETVLTDSFPMISIVFLTTFLIYVIIQVVLSIVKIKGDNSFLKKWQKYSALQLENDRQEAANTASGTFSGANKKIAQIFVFVGIVFFLCSMFQFSGSQNAESCTEYYIATDYESKVIVHTNQEYYVLMKRKGDSLTREYEIVPLSEIGNIRYEKTGKLNILKTPK